MLGAFMAILDIQITNAALKDITGTLGATLEEGSWISTSYLVAEIIIIPLSAWLTDVLSLRRYFIGTAILFLIFSVMCAWSWDLTSMIVFRAMQGITGGALIPLALVILLTYLPKRLHPVGMAMFALTATFAPAIGPTIGGWLTENFTWVSIFYINLVPGTLLIVGSFFSLKSEPMQLSLLKKGDYPGILTMAVGLGCLTVFLEEGERKDWFGSNLILWLGIISALSLTAFLIIEFYEKEPFINLRLFKNRAFGLATIINMSVGLGLYGFIYILPLYLAQVQGYNAMQIGETIMWLGVPQLFIIPFIPLMMKHLDLRVMVFVGLCLFGASSCMNAFLTNQSGMDQLKYSQIVRAFGQPLIMVPLLTIATGTLSHREAGSASGLFNMTRNLGGSVGIALLSTLLTMREHFHSERLGEAISESSPYVRERLTQMTQYFIVAGSDPVTASQQAYASIDLVVRREAYVMAYNDCFWVIGIALAICSTTVIFLPKVRAGVAPVAH